MAITNICILRFGYTLPLQNDLYKRQYSRLRDLFHVLTNWSKISDLESSQDKTVLYHYFEVSKLKGEFVRCIIKWFGLIFIKVFFNVGSCYTDNFYKP